MSPVLLILLAVASPPPDGARDLATPPAVMPAAQAPKAARKVDPPPREGAELRDAVRAALSRWARPSDAQAEAAAREFLTLYKDLQADDRLPRSQRQYFLCKVRSRLMGLSDQITARIARQKRQLESAQTAPPQGKDGPPGGAVQDPAATRGGSGDDGLAASPSIPAFGGGAMQMPDYGPQLVELIQTVIRPETWDVNGGRGTIYYWYPGRALVIRQTDEVHGEVGGVLDQLRRAGQ